MRAIDVEGNDAATAARKMETAVARFPLRMLDIRVKQVLMRRFIIAAALAAFVSGAPASSSAKYTSVRNAVRGVPSGEDLPAHMGDASLPFKVSVHLSCQAPHATGLACMLFYLRCVVL